MKPSENIKEKALGCAKELRDLGLLPPDKDPVRILELWMLRAAVDAPMSSAKNAKPSIWERVFGHKANEDWQGPHHQEGD